MQSIFISYNRKIIFFTQHCSHSPIFVPLYGSLNVDSCFCSPLVSTKGVFIWWIE